MKGKILKVIPLFGIAFAFTLACIVAFGFLTTKADMVYKIITDSDGVTWQYGYDVDTKQLDVMFFDSENEITEIIVPESSYFVSNDESIDEVESYSFSNYESHNLGDPRELASTIEKIDLSNVDVVNGIKPLSNNLDSVEIVLNPNSSKIGKDAFRSLKLTISNLDKVLEIGPGAFYQVVFTDTIISLPNVTSVLDGSFEESNITSLEINSPEIGVSAFKNCKRLSSVKLLDNVESILDSAFEGDSELNQFLFNHVQNIGNSVFKDCTKWNIDIKDTEIKQLGTGVFWGDTSYRISVTLPAGVTSIGWRTFFETNIVGVDLRNATVVGPEAFRDCKQLKDVSFGKVETINYRAFVNDSSIHNLNLSTGVIDVQMQAFDNCSIENLNLNGVQKIEHGAFANNIIRELYLPKSLAVMNTAAIWYNNPITKITVAFDTLSNAINMLWVLLDKDGSNYTDATYNGSRYLETVELVAPYSSTESAEINSRYGVPRSYHPEEPANMISKDRGNDQNWANRYKNVVQSSFLNNLLNLKTVKIGEGYEFLGASQFNAWYDYSSSSYIPKDKLKSISLPSTLKGIGAAAFQQTFTANNVPTINLPQSLEYIGASAFLLSFGFWNDIYLPNLKEIGSYAFMYSGIVGITLNNKLEYIGREVANLTPNLKKIILDCDFYNLVKKYDSDYYANNQIFAAYFPTSYNGFYYGNSHNGEYDLIQFTSNVKTNPTIVDKPGQYYNDGAFHNIKVKTFDLKNSKITSLGNNNTFLQTTVSTLVLPDALTSIGRGAFYKSKIDNLVLSNTNVERIGDLAFMEVEANKLYLPNSLKEIGSFSFLRAKVANSITVPDSVTTFGTGAFMSADIYVINNLPNSLKTIGDYALLDAVYNSDIIVPSGVTSIGYNAFNGGSNTVWGHKHLNLERNSVTFLNSMNATVTKNQPIHVLFKHSKLNELIFSENVMELPTNSLNNGKEKKLTVPEFAQMDVKKITLKNIKKIPSKAFLECHNLEEVDMSTAGGLNEFGYYAFIDTPALRKVKVRQGLDITIKDFAFLRSGLETLGDEYTGFDVSNNNITLDGEFIFSYMPNLKDVKLKGEKINNGILPKGTFYQDKKLETVILDDKFKELKAQTFANDDSLKTFVMFGDTKIYDDSAPHKVTFPDIEELTIYADSTDKDFTITIKDADNGNTTITYSDFTDDKYVYKKNGALKSVTLETENEVFLDKYADSIVHIRDISTDTITIDPRANVYCYLKNEHCNAYNETYREQKVANESDLYYLDEVLYLDSNKTQIDMTNNQSSVLTDGLALYALRRDGIILVSEEWGKMTDAVNYVDSGITIRDYNANTTNPRLRVFNTPIPINEVDTTTNDNFANVNYTIGEIDPETKRIPINFIYPNKVVDSVAETSLRSIGNTASVIYSDGCGGEAFANVIYTNVVIGANTPLFEGTPLRNGYEFIGWNKEISSSVSEDVIYVAQWKKVEMVYPDPSVDPIIPKDEKPSIIDVLVNPETRDNILIFVIIILSGVGFTYYRKNVKN